MPEQPSEFNQASFIGGMNLLGDDSRLSPNQYRAGFNLTNRYDELDPVLMSVADPAIPVGIVQEIVTFGNYIILFVSGTAWYRYYTDTGWQQIKGFQMSSAAPRFWTVAIPVATTNYLRIAASSTLPATAMSQNFISDSRGPVQIANVAGAARGNLPGLLVQDNVSQPQFIFLGGNGIPTVRVTQTFSQWAITFTDPTNTVVAKDDNNTPLDNREYVPIGNSMTWENGILYITSPDGNFIYPSVSGRPLDFMRNVTNLLVTNAPYTQVGGGDVSTTAYSVGVGGITCLRPMSSGGIFVSASNANFNVTLNQTPGAPTIFGEYTFNRKFLFNANCLSDRAIFDSIGDTRFIDLTGVRSFNAVESTQNEGRNTVFTATIQKAFVQKVGGVNTNIVQDPAFAAAILYDDYELYAMQTIFGPALCKYDTVNKCWTSFDTQQTGGSRIKILAKIELAIQRLYAVTEDNKLYTLYIGPKAAIATCRTVGVCANMLYANYNIKMNNPKSEVQLKSARAIFNNVTDDTNLTFTPYVNNRVSRLGAVPKVITYQEPITTSTDPLNLPDVNTMLSNVLFSTPNAEQGWKVFGIFTWDGGALTQFSMELENLTPMNPALSQGVAV